MTVLDQQANYAEWLWHTIRNPEWWEEQEQFGAPEPEIEEGK